MTSKIGQQESLAIKYIRVICIFFMIYVHLPPGIDGVAYLLSPLKEVSTVFQDVLGRGSVSTLSLISGFLAYFTLTNRPWLKVCKSKAKALIAPMAFWNIIAISLGFLVLMLMGREIVFYRSIEGLAWWEIIYSKILALDYGSVTVSANFIRDLFVCTLIYKPLLVLVERYGLYTVIGFQLVDMFVGFSPIIYRGNILVLYVLGIYLAYRGFLIKQLNPYKYIIFSLIACVFSLELLGSDVLEWQGYELIKRLSLSAFILYAAGNLINAWVGSWLAKLEPVVFLTYLSHNIVFLVIWQGWSILFGEDLDSPYLIFFLVAPIITFCIVYVSSNFLRFLPSFLQTLISGKVSS